MTADRDDDSSSFFDRSKQRPSTGFHWGTSFSASTGASASTSTSSKLPDSPADSTAMSRLDHSNAAQSDRSMALVALSPYSPVALRSLRQPVPSDAPANVDSAPFTFEDAFENLLAVSHGRPLPDINWRHEQRRLLQSMFPSGEPASFWLRRISSQGLLDISTPRQLLNMSMGSNWDLFHRELDRMASDVCQTPARRVNRDWDSISEEFSRDSRKTDNGFWSEPRRKEPDSFEELFSAMESSFSNSQSSWDSFVKSFSNGNEQVESESKSKNQEVSKDEYVDRFGYLHSKVTVKTLDEDGNQIGSQTHWSVRPAEKENSDEAPNKDDSGLHVDGRVESKSSWFWK